MNILALDTSMGVCSAALQRIGGPAAQSVVRETEMVRGHAEALMPMVEDVLSAADIAVHDLDRIAATLGPGSFTGVRIAIAAARGLALVSHAALYGADSLTVMARAAQQNGLIQVGPFAVGVDARRGMLYLGLYDAAGMRIEGPALYTPEEAAGLLPQGLGLAIGNGAGLLAEAAERQGRTLVTDLPALQPGALALAELASESTETTDIIRPLYLRPPDAKPQNTSLERR